jgi:hypothetical protein
MAPTRRGPIACMMAVRLHTLLYYMQDARTGGANAASNGTKARMCVPRAASCDLQEHGIDPLAAGSMEWDSSWMRTMYLFSRCRYVFHCSGHGCSAKLIAGNHEARRHSNALCSMLQKAMRPARPGRWPVSGRSLHVVSARKHEQTAERAEWRANSTLHNLAYWNAGYSCGPSAKLHGRAQSMWAVLIWENSPLASNRTLRYCVCHGSLIAVLFSRTRASTTSTFLPDRLEAA